MTISQFLCRSHPCHFHRVQADHFVGCMRPGFAVPFIFKEGISQCSCRFVIWFWSQPDQRDWATHRRPDVLFSQTVTLCLWRLVDGVMDFPGNSAAKESVCNAGEPGSTPSSEDLCLLQVWSCYVDPLQFYGVSKSLSANSEKLEIIACLRERNRFRESTKPGSD